MKLRPNTTPQSATLAMIALCCAVFSLTACGPSNAPPKPLKIVNPVTEAPGVMIKFQLNGEEHSVSGHPDLAFCDPDRESFLFSTTDSQHDSGASFNSSKDGMTWVGVFAAADFAVQFTGNGTLKTTKASDGTTTYSVAKAEGHAGVMPRDPNSKLQVADFDLQKGEYVEATASFLLSCPAE
jgi:hypothetical protein